MQKPFFALALFALAANYLMAQDMPPLPPMADQTTVTTTTDNNAAAPALPPLPSQDSTAAPAANNSSAPALPPLPDASTSSAQANSNAPALPPLPDQKSSGTSSQVSPAMPPLPDQNAATSNAAPANPPLPGDQTQAAAPSTAPALPAKKKAVHEPRPWERTKHRANVIFAGWVNAKGGNESSRIAWTAQEVMNALAFHKYKVLHEDGKYQGQADADGKQWREITFSIPKSKKLTLPVYMRQVGKKVWLRVGPSEPPAFAVYSVTEVQKMREANLKALHLIQKEMGRRLGPGRVERSWEAAYDYNRHNVVE